MFKFLQGDECPICKCNIIEAESVETEEIWGKYRYREHVNGGRWEKRKFACGCQLEYIPNYHETQMSSYHKCKNNEEYIIRERKRADFQDKLQKFIRDYDDVDEEYKNDLLGK